MHQTFGYDVIQSLIAMFIAWFIGYIYFSIYMVHFSGWGYVTDFSAIFFWTGIFAFVASITFVPLTVKLFNKFLFVRTKVLFPLFTVLASQIALTILLLPFTNFQPFQMGVFYYIYAAVIGLVFGLFYLWFQTRCFFSNKDRITKRIAILISPIVYLLFLFYLLPYINPAIAYRYFGNSIKEKAIEFVLSKYKVGDEVKEINNQLPGFTGNIISKGNMSGSSENFSYNIEFENGIITKITISNIK